MKIRCDVCQRAEAVVFCAADEAALCEACDHSVHHANKLAGKHHRFTLLPPSSDQVPLCDICQEKRGFLFCQQDRAILCRNCDESIHRANEHTERHSRFLLTGIKLSVDSSLYVPPPPSSTSASILKSKSQKPNNPPYDPPAVISKTTEMGDRRSMSEYLMEMLPGWSVEDLLDSSSPSSDDFCKTIEPLWDEEIIGNQNPFISSDKTGIWVPQSPLFSPTLIPPSIHHQQLAAHSNIAAAAAAAVTKKQKEGTQNKLLGRKKRGQGCFIVPEIRSQPNISFKKYRTNPW